MAKKKEKPPEEGSPAWMATFSDLMNLLLCFFVLLFASSTVDEGKLQNIAASFDRMSFSILPQGAINLIQGMSVSGGVSQLPNINSVLTEIGYAQEESGNNVEEEAIGDEGDKNNKSNDDADLGTEENTASGEFTEESKSTSTEESEVKDVELSEEELKEQMSEKGEKQSEEMYDEIRELLESYSIEDMQQLDYNSQYVELDMNGSILFDSGSANFAAESKIYLQKIASILVKYRNNIIKFEGHTDNVPMTSGTYKDNRELSTARANSVYEFISSQQNFLDGNIEISGYGESRPITSNETAAGRARNRRVVIKIYNQLNSQIEEGDSLQ